MSKKIKIIVASIIVAILIISAIVFVVLVQKRRVANVERDMQAQKQTQQSQQQNSVQDDNNQNQVEKQSLAKQDMSVNDQQQKGEKADVQNLKINKIDISDWKIYRNKIYGFEIKYPRNLLFHDVDQKNNIPNTALEEYSYVYFNPNPTQKNVKEFYCGALYVDVHNLPRQDMTFDDLLIAMNKSGETLLNRNKFFNKKEINLNGMRFLISDQMPYSIIVATIINDKYYVIEIGNDEGGLLIDDCRDEYLNFLDTFKIL